MSSVLERRRELLDLMRKLTLRKGHFTVNDIADITTIPRSTVQDWVIRLIEERCVIQKEEKRGRTPAKYVTSSAMLSSACRRIFTTVDDECVAIYHECMSDGCAAFCAFHHAQAGGAVSRVEREGRLLLEYATVGERDANIGLYPASAVGVLGVRRKEEHVIQRIRCIGGPAYSLTDMMKMAEGVEAISLAKVDTLVEGEVMTKALTHVIIGIDDTDTAEGGATFALALGLLQYLGKMEGVIPIGHRVVMLNPDLPWRTAGNSCSFIELAVDPERCTFIAETVTRFVSEESLSGEWGVAIKRGFLISGDLRTFGARARTGIVTREEAESVARAHGISLYGGNGVVGAVAAVAFRGIETAKLLDPRTS
jgi:hypothetical protein